MELKRVLKELLRKNDMSLAQPARRSGVVRQTLDIIWTKTQKPKVG